jgi:hypothetical protein
MTNKKVTVIYKTLTIGLQKRNKTRGWSPEGGIHDATLVLILVISHEYEKDRIVLYDTYIP